MSYHKTHRKKLRITVIAAIIASSTIMLVMCVGVVWMLALKCALHTKEPLAFEPDQKIAKTNEFQRTLVKTKKSGNYAHYLYNYCS